MVKANSTREYARELSGVVVLWNLIYPSTELPLFGAQQKQNLGMGWIVSCKDPVRGLDWVGAEAEARVVPRRNWDQFLRWRK